MVTVLMPVYNAEKYLKEAVDSILNQTYQDFDLMVINDGSTDESRAIIEGYQDSRIKLINIDSNIGLVKTLNRGIDLIDSKYIVRMDADDVSLPTRIEKLVAYMNENLDTGICGSWFDVFSETHQASGARYPKEDFQIKLAHLYQINVSHGTTIIRTDVLKKNNLRYQPKFSHAEDYELFDRIGTVSKLANIQEVLYQVRHRSDSVSKVFAETQSSNSDAVKTRIFRRMGLDVRSEDLRRYEKLLHQNYLELKSEVIPLLELLNGLFHANCISKEFDTNRFREHLSFYWLQYCNANSSWTFNANRWLSEADFILNTDYSLSRKIKMRIKALLSK